MGSQAPHVVYRQISTLLCSDRYLRTFNRSGAVFISPQVISLGISVSPPRNVKWCSSLQIKKRRCGVDRNSTPLPAVLKPLVWSCVLNLLVPSVVQAPILRTKGLQDGHGVLFSRPKHTIFIPGKPNLRPKGPVTSAHCRSSAGLSERCDKCFWPDLTAVRCIEEGAFHFRIDSAKPSPVAA